MTTVIYPEFIPKTRCHKNEKEDSVFDSGLLLGHSEVDAGRIFDVMTVLLTSGL